MLDLLRLYLANLLASVFEDHTIHNQLSDGYRCEVRNSERGTADDELQQQVEVESQASSLGEDLGDNVQARQRRRIARSSKKSSKLSRKDGTRSQRERGGNFSLLDSSGPKLIHGVRSWIFLFQIIGQVNWSGVPLYLSFIYKASLFSMSAYFFVEDFVKPQISSNVIYANYKNPILIFIGVSSTVTTIVHAALTIYSNLFNLCPLFKVLTTPRLCFIKKEVQHIVGSKSLFFMLLFHVYQCILLQMLGLKDPHEFFNQFQVGRFILDSFVIICLTYLLVGIIHIDFYIRICFGFWIIAMKTNLENRFAYLQRHDRLCRLASLSTTINTRASLARSYEQRAASYGSVLDHTVPKPGQTHEENKVGLVIKCKESYSTQSSAQPDIRSQNSVETNISLNTNSTPTDSERRPTTAQSIEQMMLNSFRQKYKLETMDEIQKSLNTMDDHLEVCRGIQNGSLVLITLNAFLTNGALLLLAYNLFANQGKHSHGIIMVLLSANNTLLVFLCYIGDSWISYALGSFVQTVEDEYFLQGGDDCESIKQMPVEPKSLSDCENYGDLSSPLTISTRPANRTSEAGSETTGSYGLSKQNRSAFLIHKRDVLFCREFLHQFENHLSTPWSKLTVKIHMHMLGAFVTLIAAQIIFDREH